MKAANQQNHIQILFLRTAGYFNKSLMEFFVALFSVGSSFKVLIFEAFNLFHLQASVNTLMASSFLPFDKSHLGDSGKKYHRDIKGRAESPMNSSKCFMLGIRYTTRPNDK